VCLPPPRPMEARWCGGGHRAYCLRGLGIGSDGLSLGTFYFIHSLPRVSWVGLSAVPLFCPLSSSGGPGSPALADEVGWLMGLGRLLVDRCGSLPLCLYMQRV
jgi:hypothetical protein